MSDDAVDKFFDEMVSPASTPTESTPPDEADKPGEPDAIMDDSTGRDEPEHGPSTPGGVTDGLERPSFWTDDMERDFQEEVRTMFDDMVNRQRGELSVREQCEHAYEQLTAAVNGKYKELTGKDLPSSMARNLDQLLTQITMAPLNEPEHGPGLWAKLPQNSLATMVEARPLDLTGSPTRMDIDLMMLHTIRMGRFLTTHYTDWARTLPSCWIRHDDVVQEVYSLKCYMDMIVASPNGGLYAPTLQSLIHSSLERVKGYLSSADTSSADHKHHLSTADDRKREQARCDEYRHWFERDGGWAGEPGFGPSWRFTNASEGLDAVCDLMTPTRVDDEDNRDDKALSDQVDKWRAGLEGLRGNYAMDHKPEHLAAARNDEERIRRALLDYTTRERSSRDRLDRAVTAAVRLTRDQERSMPMTDEDRRALADLIDQGRSILREYGSSQFDDAYQPCSIDMQDDLTERLNRLVDGDPANVFDHCDRMLDQLDDVFERGKDGR